MVIFSKSSLLRWLSSSAESNVSVIDKYLNAVRHPIWKFSIRDLAGSIVSSNASAWFDRIPCLELNSSFFTALEYIVLSKRNSVFIFEDKHTSSSRKDKYNLLDSRSNDNYNNSPKVRNNISSPRSNNSNSSKNRQIIRNIPFSLSSGFTNKIDYINSKTHELYGVVDYHSMLTYIIEITPKSVFVNILEKDTNLDSFLEGNTDYDFKFNDEEGIL